MTLNENGTRLMIKKPVITILAAMCFFLIFIWSSMVFAAFPAPMRSQNRIESPDGVQPPDANNVGVPEPAPVEAPVESMPVDTRAEMPDRSRMEPSSMGMGKSGNTVMRSPDKELKNGQVHLDFNDVDIRVFIKFMSEITGKNFVIDRRVSGKVSIVSPGTVSIKEAYRVFESVLEVHDFAAVKSGKLIKIIPARDAQQKSILTRLKQEGGPTDDSVVTQLIPLKYADPDEVKRLLTPLVSRNSSVLSYNPTNMLIVTDLASNIKRLMKILHTIDITGIGQEITVIPLEHADCTKFNTLLTTVFKSQIAGKNKALNDIKFVADERTNSIVILASKGETEKIASLVKLLDKEVPQGKEKIHVYYLANAIADDLATVLLNLTKKGSLTSDKGKAAPIQGDSVQITADKSTNSLIIVAEKSDYAVLEDVIKKLDIPRTMVYIECLIMEVNVDKSFNLGTEWTAGKATTINGKASVVGGGFGADGASGYSNLAGLAGVTTAGVGTLPSGFSMGVFSEALKIGGVTFPSLGAVIQAYKKDTDVKILSTPQVLTTDNEEASITVGQKIPFLTKSVTSDTTLNNVYNNYDYKDVGISLKITPHISSDRKIRLKISQETSRVIGDSTSLSPSTLKRAIDTTVIVGDGNTVVLGGLIDKSYTKSTSKVPCLGDIPVVKYLFSSIGNSSTKTNLYIFLTSHVVGNSVEADALYKKKYKEINGMHSGRIKMYPGENNPDGKKRKPVNIGPVIEDLDVKTNKE
jgi:general secretion pathway protein D